MLIRVDPSSEAPIFEQLAASVRAEIARGSLVPGDRLPSAREVSEALEVNIHTVLHAYPELRDEGLVDLRRGRGAVITDLAIANAELHPSVQALVAEARHRGIGLATVIALINEEFRS
jgi:GntR family transcriptional regulator